MLSRGRGGAGKKNRQKHIDLGDTVAGISPLPKQARSLAPLTVPILRRAAGRELVARWTGSTHSCQVSGGLGQLAGGAEQQVLLR